MKKTLMIGIPILLVAGLLAAGSIGFREHRHGMGKDFLSYKLERLSKELGLDASQQAQLDRIKQDLESKMDSRMQKRAEIHKLLKEEFSKENPNLDKVKPVIHQQIDEMARIGHDMVNQIDEFYVQLKPEQKQMLSEHILEKMDRRGHGFED